MEKGKGRVLSDSRRGKEESKPDSLPSKKTDKERDQLTSPDPFLMLQPATEGRGGGKVKGFVHRMLLSQRQRRKETRGERKRGHGRGGKDHLEGERWGSVRSPVPPEIDVRPLNF